MAPLLTSVPSLSRETDDMLKAEPFTAQQGGLVSGVNNNPHYTSCFGATAQVIPATKLVNLAPGTLPTFEGSPGTGSRKSKQVPVHCVQLWSNIKARKEISSSLHLSSNQRWASVYKFL